jgi:hypothetical protein
MNLLSTIIERLNQRVEAGNIFDQIYGLCELSADGNDKAWIHYIGNGQAIPVTNFDAKQGTIFWAKRGKISVSKNESFKLAGCKALYETKFTLSAYAVVRKDHLPCDSADAQDWIASRVLRLVSGSDPQFKTAIGVVAYEVVPNGYVNEIKSLTANYEWACVSIDVDVNVLTSSEDGCYDTCATGDIPLPDFLPCTPCLTEVAVDGITIIGNGTVGDPLIAIGGGGGGGALIALPFTTDHLAATGNAYAVGNIVWYLGNVYRCIAANDSILPTNTTYWVNLGAGFSTVQQPSDWNATSGNNQILNKPTITPPQSLQEVTDVGNTTDNDIQFDAGVGVLLNNTSRLREGTIDAGLGGTKGIAQICAVGYELKWEAGRLYVMDGNGILIRWSLYNFNVAPTVNDDNTKGYITGSRWSLDDGTVYLCSDGTAGAAVWTLQTSGGVTDVTATAPLSSTSGSTPDISISQADGSTDGYLSSTDWNTFDGKFNVPTGTNTDYLDGTGTPTPFPTIPTGTVTSVDLTMPAAFSVTGNPVTTSGTLAVAAAGLSSQYIRGDGQLANFPTSGGGGSSLNYYLNGSVSQGTLDGVAFKQMSSTPVIGGGTNFSRGTDGYIESFITDASVPNQILIPSGNWLFEMYFQANNSGGSPRFYVELWKLSTGTLSLISSSVANPEFITNGNQIDLYTTALAVPSTVLLAADRLAIRVYVITTGKTITLHTENSNLCEVITTFSTGINALNGLTAQVQNLAVGTSGSDFAISSASSTHTFNLPTASASNRGALSSGDWSTFNGKFNTPSGTTAQYLRGDGSLATFPTVPLIYKDVNNQTPVTGVTTNTKVVGVLIPANTITVGAIVEIKARMTKPAGNGLMTLRVYANTADSIVSPAPTLLMTAASNNVNQNYTGIDRTALIKSSTVTQTASATSSVLTDASTFQGVVTNSNVDWTVNQYIIFAIQNGSAADATTLSYYEIQIK